MPAAKPSLTRLREDVVLQTPPAQGQGLPFDAEQHVVRGLKIVGLESKWGRRYLLETLRDAVERGLYEGVKCNIDHVSESAPDVPFAKRFGIFRNARLQPDGVWADLEYNPDHDQARPFVWWTQRCPEAVGFSHDALGDSRPAADGWQDIHVLHEVYSVDLVANPATTNGLRESDMDPLINTDPAVPGDEMQWDEQLGNLIKSIFCDKSLDEAGKKEDHAGGSRWPTRRSPTTRRKRRPSRNAPETT